MNDNATLLYALIAQAEAPLSTQALAELAGLKFTDISECSKELLEMGVNKTTLGYSLPKAVAETEESLQLRLVRLLAHSSKRLFLSNLAEGVGAKVAAVKTALDELEIQGVIDLRSPGHYHFTEQGLKYIEEHYPQITVPPFVTAKIKAQINDFTIKPSRAKTQLKPLRDINRTIATLTALTSSSAGATKTDLLELIEHLAATRAINNQGFQHG